MTLKVLLLHQSFSDTTECLASLGSFSSHKLTSCSQKYITELAKGGEFDIYMSRTCPCTTNYFAVVSIDHVDVEQYDVIQVVAERPNPTEIKDLLIDRKEQLKRQKPSNDEPFIPRWIEPVLHECVAAPNFTDDVTVEDVGHDESLLERAKSTDYSALSFTHQQLCSLAYSILVDFAESLRLDLESLKRFILFICANYRSNSYHNFRHAVDVMQSVWCFIRLSTNDVKLTVLEHFTILVAALAHDVGHFGFKNKFIIESEHPLALIYNDRSPVENYHCLILFSILRHPECQFGVNWDGTMRREFRRLATSLILATDMIYHFEYVKKLQNCHKCQLSATCCAHRPALSDIPDQRLLNMIMLIKAADLCNVVRPFDVAEKWGTCLQTEFYHQGDWEKHLGIECPVYDDRQKDDFPSSQTSFLKNVALPLYSILAERLPALSIVKDALTRNIEAWQSRM